jgi:tRNA A-37 threonylcarbamoyl transferase component Bud32
MEKIIAKKINGVHWRTDEASTFAPERLASALAVKHSRVRDVFFLPAHESHPASVLKVYRARGAGALARTLLLGSPAQREWNALRRLRSAGVNAPQPLALGTKPPFSSYLVTRRIESCATLEDLLLGKAPCPVAPKDLAEACGRLIRSMHEAGVEHRDLHAANLLVDPEGRPHVTDLHGARLARTLSRRARTRDLLSLAGAFLIHGSQRDRFRFFKAYSNAGQEEARRIEHLARERLFLFLRKFDRRCLRGGRNFQTLGIHELTGMAERSDRALVLARSLGPYPVERLEERGQRLHTGAGTRVYAFQVDGNHYIVKSYRNPGAWEIVKRLFRGSKAQRCWLNYHKLIFRGLSIPKPVLFLEDPLGSPLGRSFVATEAADEHIMLDVFLDRADRAALLTVLHRLAAAVARMHRLFLRNRDMKAQNILVSPSMELLFIDPDGVESMRDPYPYVLARDLMRINASFTTSRPVSLADRLRFLKRYMKHMGFPRSSLRELWRETVFLTWEKWERWKKTAK